MAKKNRIDVRAVQGRCGRGVHAGLAVDDRTDMHYAPGISVSQPYRQRFWAAVHAGTIDPEKEAWCLVRMHHPPASTHPDALVATRAACDPYPDREMAVYGQGQRPKYPAAGPCLSGPRWPISIPAAGQKGWMSRRSR